MYILKVVINIMQRYLIFCVRCKSSNCQEFDEHRVFVIKRICPSFQHMLTPKKISAQFRVVSIISVSMRKFQEMISF